MNHVEPPPVWRQCALVGRRTLQTALLCGAHLVSWAVRRAAFWRPAAANEVPERLTGLLEDLGPTFVKAGQILSARPDLTTPELAAALSRLREHVRPVDAPVIVAAIERSFGAPIGTLFATFEAQPVAGGSIAQVHRAALPDGRIVAVKVRRPDAMARVAADFTILRTAARILARLPRLRRLPIPELVEEIARSVSQQLDFRLEAQNHRALRRVFQNTEQLSIPALVDDLCSECVLTMDYVDDLQDLTKVEWPPRERREAALVGLRALYRMIFEVGLVHADMHPGNVFRNRNGKVVLLDMGLVAKLSPADKAAFVDFFFGLVTGRGDECARVVVEGATAFGPRYDAEQFGSAMRSLVSRYSRQRSRAFEIARFVAALLAVQRRYDVRGSTAFITTVLGMVVYDGICKQLYPDCDFQAEARGFLILARYGRSTRRLEPAL